jgi:hypothetical protein
MKSSILINTYVLLYAFQMRENTREGRIATDGARGLVFIRAGSMSRMLACGLKKLLAKVYFSARTAPPPLKYLGFKYKCVCFSQLYSVTLNILC